jgi:hypothetical protein
MVAFLIGLTVGAFVGWNLPQPEWARRAQESVKDWFNS